MKKSAETVLLLMLLIGCFWRNSCSSTSELQTYLAEDSKTSSQQGEPSNFLFAQQGKDSTEVEIPNSLKLKSPYMAAFYSVIPGVLVHGCGHFYAGKTGTGGLLLGLEAGGVVLLYVSFLSAFGGATRQADTDAIAFTGLLLFEGSWVYDFVASPIVVVRQNKYLRQEKRTGLKFQMKDGDLRLVPVWRFQI